MNNIENEQKELKKPAENTMFTEISGLFFFQKSILLFIYLNNYVMSLFELQGSFCRRGRDTMATFSF